MVRLESNGLPFWREFVKYGDRRAIYVGEDKNTAGFAMYYTPPLAAIQFSPNSIVFPAVATASNSHLVSRWVDADICRLLPLLASLSPYSWV